VGTGGVGDAEQGQTVSISADGNTAIVGGNRDNGTAGTTWIYTRSGGVWSQQGNKLKGIDAMYYPYQGNAVSISADGNTALVGGYNDNLWAGAAWVYTRTGGACENTSAHRCCDYGSGDKVKPMAKKESRREEHSGIAPRKGV
jgi:hypothetical protein